MNPREYGFFPKAFRYLFRTKRPRGYMRLGQWLARVSPEMQRLPVDLPDGTTLVLDMRRIDEQPIFLNGYVDWEPEEQILLSGVVQPGNCVIDVGAHIGLYSRALARLVGSGGQVVAYEPDPSSLLQNVADLPQVLVRTFAVGDKEGPVHFLSERSGALSRIVSEMPKGHQVKCVRSVTIDEEVSRLHLPPVDFIKIDVEGGEEFVLQGAENTLRSENPPAVLFEWIPSFRSRHRRGAFEVLRSLARGEWRLWRIGWGMPLAEIERWDPPKAPANVFAVTGKRAAIAESAIRGLCKGVEKPNFSSHTNVRNSGG